MPYSKFIDSDEAFKNLQHKVKKNQEKQTVKTKIKYHKKTVCTMNPLIRIFVK